MKGNRWFGWSVMFACFVAAANLAWFAPKAVSSTPVNENAASIELPRLGSHGVRLEFQDHDEPPIFHPVQGIQSRPPIKLGDRLKIPTDLPGAESPPLELPKLDLANPREYEDALKKHYPPLPPVGLGVTPGLGPDGQPWTLDDLQRQARATNPLLRQAEADINAARGAYRQAGLYKNPVIGLQWDALHQGRTLGSVGGFVSQEVVWMCKLRLAQAVAASDRELAQLALVQMEAEITFAVRQGYFALLAAQETMRIQDALTRFTDEVYRVQVDQLKAGQAAGYEPMQVRVLAFQARAQLVQARNRYVATWKQLAATLGQPQLPPTQVVGRIDQPLPLLRHEWLLSKVLVQNSEVQSAQQRVEKAEKNVRLAEVNRIPNVTLSSTVQKDYTTPPLSTMVSMHVGVPVPIWDRNQGNIDRARAELVRAQEESARVRNQLTAQVADAFGRYDNQRRLIVYYRDHILPDQVRAYRGVYGRHLQDPDRVSFGDIVTAQQTLAGAIASYLQTLQDAWLAVIDLGRLAQVADLDGLVDQTCGTLPNCLRDLPGCAQTDGIAWPDAMPLLENRPPSTLREIPGPVTLPDKTSATPAMRPSSAPGNVTAPMGEKDETIVLPQQPPAPLLLPGETPGSPTPRIIPSPATAPVFVSPVGPLEKSTKRRKLMTWPWRKSDGESPLLAPFSLPRFDDGQCPTCLPETIPPNPQAPSAPPVAFPVPISSSKAGSLGPAASLPKVKPERMDMLELPGPLPTPRIYEGELPREKDRKKVPNPIPALTAIESQIQPAAFVQKLEVTPVVPVMSSSHRSESTLTKVKPSVRPPVALLKSRPPLSVRELISEAGERRVAPSLRLTVPRPQ